MLSFLSITDRLLILPRFDCVKGPLDRPQRREEYVSFERLLLLDFGLMGASKEWLTIKTQFSCFSPREAYVMVIY